MIQSLGGVACVAANFRVEDGPIPPFRHNIPIYYFCYENRRDIARLFVSHDVINISGSHQLGLQLKLRLTRQQKPGPDGMFRTWQHTCVCVVQV